MTLLGHSCVRVEHAGATLVVDPGCFSDPAALDGADAVLITHQHDDHLDETRLRAFAADRPHLEVWTTHDTADKLGDLGKRVHAVTHGQEFSAAGVAVAVFGDTHARVHPSLGQVDNIGFLFEGHLFHPGDALTVPDAPVTELLVPVAAPWVKLAEVADYVEAVGPDRAYLIHGALLSEVGLNLYHRVLSTLTGAPERRELNASDSGHHVDTDDASRVPRP
ncbi:MBL fold metallo-hydrolase [Streptomyces polygonati]|uniref:MBL fold metallo-hydrolase n=1 Tax=Streptomyces polygonati TaxID=1617087 RepID=A0ABV8HUJ2_9ACTN